MIHIISDLNLGFHEKAEDQFRLRPEANYIIITGNISKENKRSMLFAEQVAEANPNSTVIYNFGLEEIRGKLYSAVVDGYNIRVNVFKKSPSNLKMPMGRYIDDNYDFFTCMGWPSYDQDNFNQSSLILKTVKSWNEEFWIDDICVANRFGKPFDEHFVKSMIDNECEKIKEWLQSPTEKKKILISATGLKSKQFLLNDNYTLFPDVDISEVLWISGGDTAYIEKNYISLPGRNRNYYILDDFSVFSTE